MPGAQVVDVELDRERELRIAYDDGVTCVFPVLQLRRACPCATCRGRREAGRPAFDGHAVTANGAALRGSWGIAIEWSDGHSTGIYSYTRLNEESS